MATPRHEHIGNRIKKALDSKGMTRRQLCDAAEISNSYLTKLLAGSRGERIEYLTACAIANALDVDVHRLVTGTGNLYSRPTVNEEDDALTKAARIAVDLGVSSRAIEAVLSEGASVKGRSSVRAWLLLILARNEFLRSP